MPELRAVCGAFLTAVLLCDLSFDFLAWRAPPSHAIERDRGLGAMSEYYRHVSRAGSPFASGVALVMASMLASIGYELMSTNVRRLERFVVESSLAVGPILLATLRTFPRARRLAAGDGDVATRTELARAIARDHAVALAAMFTYVVIQLVRP